MPPGQSAAEVAMQLPSGHAMGSFLGQSRGPRHWSAEVTQAKLLHLTRPWHDETRSPDASAAEQSLSARTQRPVCGHLNAAGGRQPLAAAHKPRSGTHSPEGQIAGSFPKVPFAQTPASGGGAVAHEEAHLPSLQRCKPETQGGTAGHAAPGATQTPRAHSFVAAPSGHALAAASSGIAQLVDDAAQIPSAQTKGSPAGQPVV